MKNNKKEENKKKIINGKRKKNSYDNFFIQQQPIKKRKLSLRTKKTAADLLNLISVEDCKELYENELKKYSRKASNSECIFSTRVTYVGEYPRLQIPKAKVPSKYLSLGKGSWKVGVHQLAYRALGYILSPYEDNIDVTHTCGNGRKNSKDDVDKGFIFYINNIFNIKYNRMYFTGTFKKWNS